MVDCGPVDVVLGEVIYESSGNSTVFGSRILYSCRDSLQVTVSTSLSVIDACKSGHIRCHCGFDSDWPYRHIHLSSEWAMDE